MNILIFEINQRMIHGSTQKPHFSTHCTNCEFQLITSIWKKAIECEKSSDKDGSVGK